MKRVLLAAAWLLGPVVAGCAHHGEYHEAKADYQHERAHEDMETGHPVGAVKHKIKETGEDIKSY